MGNSQLATAEAVLAVRTRPGFRAVAATGTLLAVSPDLGPWLLAPRGPPWQEGLKAAAALTVGSGSDWRRLVARGLSEAAEAAATGGVLSTSVALRSG